MRHSLPIMLLVLLPGLAACEAFSDPSFPTAFDTSIEVVSEGAGQEFGPELFPAGDGDRWLYMENGDEETAWITWPTGKTTEVNAEQVPIWMQRGNYGTNEAWTLVTKDAVQDYGNVFRLNPCTIPRLHFPVRIGKVWRTDCTSDGYLNSEATVLTVERVRTDVGWFSAVRINYVIHRASGSGSTLDWWLQGPPEANETWWFAPGIGVVKREYAQGHFHVLRHARVGGKDAAGDWKE